MAKVLFVICLVASTHIVLGRPDVSLGYRYNPGYSGSGSNVLQTPSFASGAASNNYYGNTLPFGTGGTSGFVASPVFNGQFDGSEQQAAILPAEVSKHFYVYSAPEERDEQQIVRTINIGRPRTNYRVVFINAPSSSANRAKIIANVAPVEDKTAIYVLSKKTNELDVSAEVVTPAPSVVKPEVFFIKYKTAAEAQHAQHTIQSQYDALGGSSDVSNEGTAPVSSVIGSLGGGHSGHVSHGLIGNGFAGSTGGFGGSTGGFGGSTGGFAGSSSSDDGVAVAPVGDNSHQIYLPPRQRKY